VRPREPRIEGRSIGQAGSQREASDGKAARAAPVGLVRRVDAYIEVQTIPLWQCIRGRSSGRPAATPRRRRRRPLRCRPGRARRPTTTPPADLPSSRGPPNSTRNPKHGALHAPGPRRHADLGLERPRRPFVLLTELLAAAKSVVIIINHSELTLGPPGLSLVSSHPTERAAINPAFAKLIIKSYAQGKLNKVRAVRKRDACQPRAGLQASGELTDPH
jgi:hypothetical protein